MDDICRLLVAGDRLLADLLQSPLRLVIALQTYRERDPRELLGMKPQTIADHLWELLLTLHAPTFENANAGRIRSWLAF